MEQRITHKSLTNAILKTIPEESVQFIFFHDDHTKPQNAVVQIFTIENGICTAYSGSGRETGLQIASVVRKFPMLTGCVKGDAWVSLELEWNMNLYMRKDRTPEFMEVMKHFMELPHGLDDRNMVYMIMGMPIDLLKRVAKNKPRFAEKHCMVRHWKTCTEEVMKKLA